MTSAKHTGECYIGIATAYASTVDTKSWNVHYERPATLSLLPPLRGLRVLDVGCGSGWYAQHLHREGATVTAFDLNPEFVALTGARCNAEVEVFQADLAEPLSFAPDGAFDLVLCPLVLHYLRDWTPTLCEFHRVLKEGGVLVFSTHHPTMDWQLFKTDSYFTVERLDDEWDDIGKVSFYRRPLTSISEALASAGFVIERLLEPLPSAAFKQANPNAYERLLKTPWFLFVRAMKPTWDR